MAFGTTAALPIDNNASSSSSVLTTVSSIIYSVVASMENGGILNQTVASDAPPTQRISEHVLSESMNVTVATSTSTSSGSVMDEPMQGDYICNGRWLPMNHLYFQLANLFLFLSYLAPNGIYGILYLRITICIGCFFFALWGWVILCAFDTLLWNAVFVAINVVHVIIISYNLRPIRFSNELEQVSYLISSSFTTWINLNFQCTWADTLLNKLCVLEQSKF